MTEAVETPVKKTSKSETGYAKNAANFAELITAVKSFDKQYNPSAAAITITNLEAMKTNIDSILAAVHVADTAYRDAVDKRQTAFEYLSALTTKITGALKASGADVKAIDEVNSISKKIKGIRINKAKTDEASRSTSQMSYDNRLQNFKQLIIRVSGIPEYNPNEAELTIASLNNYADTLDQLTSALQYREKDLDKYRIERGEILYNEKTGAVQTAHQVKEYVKSIYGAQSEQYKQVSSIQFKARK